MSNTTGIDEAVEFGLPDHKEREKMLELYYKKVVCPLGFQFPQKVGAQPVQAGANTKPKAAAKAEAKQGAASARTPGTGSPIWVNLVENVPNENHDLSNYSSHIFFCFRYELTV